MTTAIHDRDLSFVQEGRADMRDEIVADLDKRIAILSESIASGKHTKSNKIALQVTQRALQVARANYAGMS